MAPVGHVHPRNVWECHFPLGSQKPKRSTMGGTDRELRWHDISLIILAGPLPSLQRGAKVDLCFWNYAGWKVKEGLRLGGKLPPDFIPSPASFFSCHVACDMLQYVYVYDLYIT